MRSVSYAYLSRQFSSFKREAVHLEMRDAYGTEAESPHFRDWLAGKPVPLPGNDFWLFDDELVIFLIFAGNGTVVDRLATEDPQAIRLCRTAFEAVWDLAIPDRDYRPE